MSISEAVAIEKRFTALEDEITKLRQDIAVLKDRLPAVTKKNEAKNES